MKVVLDTFFWPGTGGGDGQVAYEISEAMAREHPVLFVRPGKKTLIRKKQPNLTVVQMESLRYDSEIHLPVMTLKNVKFLFKQLEKFDPDIIHLQDPDPLSFLIQAWGKANQVPVFLTSHVLPTKLADFGTKEVSKFASKIIEGKLFENYYQKLFDRCDAVVALNEEARKNIRTFGYQGEIFIIPNGRNLQWYNRLEYPQIPKKDEPFELLFVGNLSGRKNQKFLIEAMEYLPKHFVLNLVGPVLEKGYTDKLKRLVKEKGMENRIRFLGKLDHQEVIKVLEKTHLFVSASIMEVQSLVILESLAAGRSIVSLSNETTDQFIDQTVGVNLEKNVSSKVFAQEVEKISNLSEDRYRRLCQNARQKVASLDWSNVVRETVSAYKKTIEKRKKTDYRDQHEDLSWDELLFQKPVKEVDWKKVLKTKFKIADYSWGYLGPLALFSLVSSTLYPILKLRKTNLD